MTTKKENRDEEPFYLSPLKLICSAYTDERPTVNQVIHDNFRNLDEYLSPLPEQTRAAVFQTFCNIFMENERLAFLAGIRSGVRLMRELEEM